MEVASIKERFIDLVKNAQDSICSSVEQADGKTLFQIDDWKRPGFGHGSTRVIEKGKLFEKGGVNTSVVEGLMPKAMQEKFSVTESSFFATGISLVLHPLNPHVPTVHANFRYFELYDPKTDILKDRWFGGGADLTPYYLYEEDAVHFHRTFKTVCDKYHPDFYPRFKKDCDAYFVNTHRHETRGIGGIFYDYVRPQDEKEADFYFNLSQDFAFAFNQSYLPIAERRRSHPYSEKERYWQEIRRGRYAEFNLIHDRGTLFGLKTKGQTESILMSLPPQARWDYDYHVTPNSPEQKLIDHLKPIDWV